ncbi:hypothetical protein [Flaviaesturariibacter terrae]
MRTVLLLFLLLPAAAFAQVPYDLGLPMGVSGISFGDTAQNTRALMRQLGIRRVVQTQSSSRPAFFSPVTSLLDSSGAVLSRRAYSNRTDNSGNVFSLLDTCSYDQEGRLLQWRNGSARGSGFMQLLCRYAGDSAWHFYSWTGSGDSGRIGRDTVLLRHNSAGRLTRSQHSAAGWKEEAYSVYWAADGLPDSIVYDNPNFPVQVFQRKKKRGALELRLLSGGYTYTWTYTDGHCTRVRYSTYRKNFRTGQMEDFVTDIRYFYNDDNTLRRVEEEQSGLPKATLHFAYSR